MDSKIIRDFAPSKDNNRNSEGAFITLKNGNIMFAYSRYGGEGDDDGAAADIYASISPDGGESFGNPYPLITHNEMNADNIMSASFMRMANGDIGLFFLAKTKTVNCLCYLIRSSDEGKTWSNPVLCSEDSGYFVVNNDRIVRTKSGISSSFSNFAMLLLTADCVICSFVLALANPFSSTTVRKIRICWMVSVFNDASISSFLKQSFRF